ncbi:hypothetical protein NMBB_0359A [Neisseria meningitidis alpha710]|nr:hypothetical protein NMBB_0359A [Neisseria meningitidis alpha710]
MQQFPKSAIIAPHLFRTCKRSADATIGRIIRAKQPFFFKTLELTLFFVV